MLRLTIPCAFAAILAMPALAQEAAPPTPAPIPLPEAVQTPEAPMPIMPAETSGCGKTRQMTS